MRIADADTAALAIRTMWVRGAPLIGAVGAYGLALALDAMPPMPRSRRRTRALDATRPTAVNLRWALDRVRVGGRSAARARSAPTPRGARPTRSPPRTSRSITRSACTASRCCARSRAQAAVRCSVMTHCNAGALATCGWGTATAPLFLAHAAGLAAARVGQRNAAAAAGRQSHRVGARGARRAAHAVRRRRQRAPDAPRRRRHRHRRRRSRRAQRRRLQQDRHLRQGARRADNDVPFYVGRCRRRRSTSRSHSGAAIPIEARDADEVLSDHRPRRLRRRRRRVAIAPAGTRAVNYAFDVTPARLVTGLVTERGIAPRRRGGIAALFPERVR